MEIIICPTINKTKDRAKINKERGITSAKIYKGEWSCDLCRLKPKCKEICPPMEYIVAQVEVEPPKEQPIENPQYERKSTKWPESPTTSENIFCMFFFDQLSQVEIANKLYISQQYVSKVIRKYKEILIKNLRK